VHSSSPHAAGQWPEPIESLAENGIQAASAMQHGSKQNKPNKQSRQNKRGARVRCVAMPGRQ
jgi:hypothetical protein